MAADIIYTNNDWTIRVRLTRWDPTTSKRVPLTNAAPTGYLAATANGSAIASGVQVTLTEGAAGDYSGVLTAATLAAALGTMVGSYVYEVVTLSGGPGATFLEARQLLVTDSRVAV